MKRTLFISATLLALLYVVNFFVMGFLVGPFDYNHLSTYYELAWRFWRTSAGWPEYNPYFCGGRTLGADPQIPIFHPLVVLVGLFGPALVLRWEMLAQIALGSWGLWQWLKRWQVEVPGRLWGTLLFAGGGFIVARFMVGHVTLGFYALTPLYFYLSYRLCDRSELHRPRLALALSLLTLYCGYYKPNFFLYAVPALGIEALFRSVLLRRFAPLGILIAAVAFAGFASAVSLLPSSTYFAAFPRTFDSGPKAIPLYSLLANLLMPLKAIPKSWYGTEFMQRHEYNVFLGPVALAFAARGLRRVWPERAERLALLAFGIACAWIGLGRQGEGFSLLEPYSWFHFLWPGFESVRVPVRFWFGTYLAAIVFSSLGFAWPKRGVWQAVIVILGIFPIIGHAAVNLSKASVLATQAQWNPTRAYPADIVQKHETPDTPYAKIRVGEGVIECVENLEAFRSPILREGPLLQTRGDAPVTLNARWASWNRIVFDGHSSKTSHVAFNFNHHPFWRTSSPSGVGVVSDIGDPMTLEVPAGTFRGEMIYRQPLVRLGFWLSISTWFVAGLLYLGFRRRRPRRIGLTGGIGVGKSQVAALLKERGWWIVDLDAEGRRLTDSDTKVRDQILAEFGSGVVNAEGLDRAKLKEIVFAAPEKRRALEAILHPALMKAFEDKVREAARAKVPVVVCEAALLVETGHHRRMDSLILVTAPPGARRERVQKRDRMEAELFDRIVAAQGADAEKVQVADFIVDNSGTVEALREEVEKRIPRF